MSKVIDILKMVDELRPNAVSDLVKIQYLNEIEGEVFDIMTHYLPAEEIIKTNLEAREMLKAKTDTDADTNQTNGTVTVAEATVPEKLKDEVKTLLEADGYTVNADGTVTKSKKDS